MRWSSLDEFADGYGIERLPDTRGQRFDDFGGFHDSYHAGIAAIVRWLSPSA